MKLFFNGFVVSDDQSKVQPDRVCAMLANSYWAESRSREKIERSIRNSLCFGVYREGEQIAFARCVTDDATVFWLADVIVDERYRGRGVGKAMVSAILSHKRLKGLNGILATRDAHGLYGQFGFEPVEGRFMRKPAEQ
jgi:predicted N-acetyltransferase YhbS